MNNLYEVKGIDKKTKKETNAFVIAPNPEHAVEQCTFLVDPVFTGREETLGPGWERKWF